MTMYAIDIDGDEDGVTFTGPDIGAGPSYINISIEQIPVVVKALNDIYEDFKNV